MKTEKHIRILFIGNSHTYFNNMPYIVKQNAEREGISADVTALFRGGWYLFQHEKEIETKFNIKFGSYDYVVLQEHSHPFDRTEDYFAAAKTLCAMIHQAGGIPVIYATWSEKNNRANQAHMDLVNRQIAGENEALLANVGQLWWQEMDRDPSVDLYWDDGQHASIAGSEFAAKIIWKTISDSLRSDTE